MVRIDWAGLVLALAIGSGSFAAAAEANRKAPVLAHWPQWRGPTRDGQIQAAAWPERISGVYVTPVITYPNQDRAQYVITAFVCRPIDATEPRVNDDESLEVGYFPVDAMPEISPHHRLRIEHAFFGCEEFVAGGDRLGAEPRIRQVQAAAREIGSVGV